MKEEPSMPLSITGNIVDVVNRHIYTGTIGTISDPHEIANVLGLEGVHYMIANGKKVPLKFYFGAPSCVPATPFEPSGAVITPQYIQLFTNWCQPTQGQNRR